MPVLDWTRTDLAWPMPDGALALRFEMDVVAAYDLYILRRVGADRDYSPSVLERAGRRFGVMSEDERNRLEQTILAGLPGSEEAFTTDRFREALAHYDGIDADTLRANHVSFLEAVCPVADELDIRL